MASAQNPAARRPATGPPHKRRASGPLKIADSYLFSQVFGATMRGLLWFGGLLFMVTVVTALRRGMSNGLGISSMMQMVVYQTPRIVLFALPMSVLFGVVQAFTDLSTESEITALSAGGMSLPRMMATPLCWGAFLAVVAFILQETVVPGSQLRMDAATLSKIGGTGAKKFQWANPPIGKGPTKQLIQADRLDLSSGMMVKPKIIVFNDAGQVQVTIEAERGQWDLKSNEWKFFKCLTTYYGRGKFGAWLPKGTSKFDVAQNDVAKAPSLSQLSRTNTDARAALEADNYEYVSIWQLLDYRREKQRENATAKTKTDHEDTIQRFICATFGIHDKIATSLVVLAMVLIGAPLGLRPPRAKGQGGVAMGVSLAVLIVYYVTWTWCSAVGKNGQGSPVIFAYFSPFITFTTGLVLLAKKSR